MHEQSFDKTTYALVVTILIYLILTIHKFLPMHYATRWSKKDCKQIYVFVLIINACAVLIG